MFRWMLPVVLVICAGGVARAEEWPQWRGPRRNNTWAPPKALQALPEKARPRWTVPLGGGYGGIAFQADRVFVMDRTKGPPEVERLVCLNASDGKLLWEHSYPVQYAKMGYGNGPRCTPTVHDGKVYTLGAMGHLHCVLVKTGKVVWSRDLVKDFKGKIPEWGHACSPLVDGKQLIVQAGGENALLVGLDLESGKELWRSLADPPGYSSPVLYEIGKRRQLVYFTPRHVVGLVPETGKLIWKQEFPGITYDVSISDAVQSDGVLLASNYWSGSKAIRLDAQGESPEVVWEGKDLSLLMSTPLVQGKHVYALDKDKGLMCLEMQSGKVLWKGEHITPRGRNPHASMVWLGKSNRALILNTPGELHLVELSPTGLKRLGKMKVCGQTWAHPAFAGQHVFARTDTEVVCVPLFASGRDSGAEDKQGE